LLLLSFFGILPFENGKAVIFCYLRTQADQAKSQHLLEGLQLAHQKLQEYAAQAQELAAARERNRLARELHDSVSQAIFSITLTSQAARLLLDRDPARVPEQIDRMRRPDSSSWQMCLCPCARIVGMKRSLARCSLRCQPGFQAGLSPKL
jgi:signal transduction histidine kinase